VIAIPDDLWALPEFCQNVGQTESPYGLPGFHLPGTCHITRILIGIGIIQNFVDAYRITSLPGFVPVTFLHQHHNLFS
jgi:hypothetical protein